MHFARFPRVRFAHLPTPFEPLERLSKHLGGPRLWIKRDDCTGLATGGNKTRKLEFLMGDALAQGADTVITQGATQSNHARQTAAAAAKLGLACHVLLQDRTGFTTREYTRNGNVILDHLCGAEIHRHGPAADMNVEMETLAKDLRAKGGKPYVIPGGGSNPVGALGYAEAAMELLGQANAKGVKISHVYHATGSAGTQAGFVTGMSALNAGVPVMGISVKQAREKQEEDVFALAGRTEAHMGLKGVVKRADVVADSGYVGPGYGQPTPGMIEAVKLLASLEGILLDPVYSGKAMSGLIDHVRQGRFAKDSDVVFLHTGGSVGIFGYLDTFDSNA